jgi:hypothetical protein
MYLPPHTPVTLDICNTYYPVFLLLVCYRETSLPTIILGIVDKDERACIIGTPLITKYRQAHKHMAVIAHDTLSCLDLVTVSLRLIWAQTHYMENDDVYTSS